MAQSLSHPEERTPHGPDSADPDAHISGTMDIRAQERTFHGFMTFVTRAAILIVALLLFLALVNG